MLDVLTKTSKQNFFVNVNLTPIEFQWLPTYKGVVAGSVVAGFGLGAMVFNPIITTFINPNNTSPSYAPYPDHPSEK